MFLLLAWAQERKGNFHLSYKGTLKHHLAFNSYLTYILKILYQIVYLPTWIILERGTLLCCFFSCPLRLCVTLVLLLYLFVLSHQPCFLCSAGDRQQHPKSSLFLIVISTTCCASLSWKLCTNTQTFPASLSCPSMKCISVNCSLLVDSCDRWLFSK